MAIGLFFRNPVVPALIVYGWEWLNFLLPPSLKRISIIHYLHSLVPVPVSEGPFATVVEPTSPWLAIPGLLLLTLLVLVIASRRIRRMEMLRQRVVGPYDHQHPSASPGPLTGFACAFL
jgi:hypothetical protein